MPKKAQQDPKLTHLLGKGCAHIQDGLDQVVDWGFKKLKKLEETPPKKDEHEFLKATRKDGGFIGELGTEYYKEYEKIKHERSKKAKT